MLPPQQRGAALTYRFVRRAVRALARPVLHRAKQSQLLRRLLVPLLLRFPALKRLARLAVTPARPPADIHCADWPGPLPAEYLDMPESSRRILLDLARASGAPSHPDPLP